MEKFLIVRDTREKIGFWDWGETDECRGCTINTVSAGDYSIEGLEHLIFIERKKTSGEFASNITEKRFTKLLEKAQHYKYRFLILEFDLEEIYSFPINSGIPKRFFKRCRIKPAFLESWITRIVLQYEIQVIFAGNKNQAEKLCYSILKNIYKKENNKN